MCDGGMVMLTVWKVMCPECVCDGKCEVTVWEGRTVTNTVTVCVW